MESAPLVSRQTSNFLNIFHIQNDTLLDVYSCAYFDKSIFTHGRLYVGAQHVGFHSSVFGHVHLALVHYRDIIAVHRRLAALIFPSAIELVTNEKRYFFSSFIYREKAFNLIGQTWQRHLQQSESLLEARLNQSTGAYEMTIRKAPVVPDTAQVEMVEAPRESDGGTTVAMSPVCAHVDQSWERFDGPRPTPHVPLADMVLGNIRPDVFVEMVLAPPEIWLASLERKQGDEVNIQPWTCGKCCQQRTITFESCGNNMNPLQPNLIITTQYLRRLKCGEHRVLEETTVKGVPAADAFILCTQYTVSDGLAADGTPGTRLVVTANIRWLRRAFGLRSTIQSRAFDGVTQSWATVQQLIETEVKAIATQDPHAAARQGVSRTDGIGSTCNSPGSLSSGKNIDRNGPLKLGLRGSKILRNRSSIVSRVEVVGLVAFFIVCGLLLQVLIKIHGIEKALAHIDVMPRRGVRDTTAA